MANTLIDDWRKWDDAFKEENEERVNIDPDSLCSYGVKVLDDALFRIGKNELVVIGAETGSGKSELSLIIAQHNAMQGRTVGVYYLEGGHLEAIQRMKWRDITKKYYAEHKGSFTNMDFKQWAFNYNQSQRLSEIEGEIYNEYWDKYKDNLFFFGVNKDFTMEKFQMSLLDFKEVLSSELHLDLIIIDHLQYFSLGKAENEITEITKILREVKHITEYYNTPVILVSHLRKRGKNAGLPSHEDFYGSSNIPKISTTSIMISPAVDRDNYSKNIFPTYFRVVKSRVGIRTNYAFLTDFHLDTRSYADEYEIYRVNNLGEVWEDPLPEKEKPRWARKKSKEI